MLTFAAPWFVLLLPLPFLIWRFVPLCGVLLLIAITLCLRPLLQFRRHGTSGIFLFRSGNAAQTLRDGLLVAFFNGVNQVVSGVRLEL